MTEVQDVKLCQKCQEVKELKTGFYKSGEKCWQKYCKLCHNASRSKYATNTVYEKKPTGFNKLPEALQEKIKYDIYVKINFKDICKKYKTEYPQVKYQTLLRLNREGKIPKYQPPL